MERRGHEVETARFEKMALSEPDENGRTKE